jgi:hypothetical protein
MPITRVPGDLATIRDDIADIETDLATVEGYTEKIDDAAAGGLTGTPDSLSYMVDETHRHLHNWGRAFGAAAVPNGEIHVADRVASGINALQADGGNNDWGVWKQILGSSDTPATAGNAYYDMSTISVVGVERANAIHFVQVAFGASGAAALAAGTYTEKTFKPQTVQGVVTEVDILVRRIVVGTKAWLRVLVAGQNTGTIDFFIDELHEYEG